MYYLIMLMFMVSGCQYLPEIAEDIEIAAKDAEIIVEVSKETYSKEKDLGLNFKLPGKSEPNKSPKKGREPIKGF